MSWASVATTEDELVYVGSDWQVVKITSQMRASASTDTLSSSTVQHWPASRQLNFGSVSVCDGE